MFGDALGQGVPGFGHVGEYSVSGLPWVTGSVVSSSVVRHDFHKCTKSITVRSLGGDPLHVGFTEAGVLGSNRYTIPASGSEKFDVRTKVLFLLSDDTTNYCIFAELTMIPARHVPILTGSLTGSSAGAGWPNIG